MDGSFIDGVLLEDESEQMFDDILANHHEEARERVFSLLSETTTDENGCMCFGCKAPRKTRFKGYRIKTYRFIFCVLNKERPSKDWVIRHRCANPLCVNPDHLELGTQRDNWRDHLQHSAYGIDFDLL